MASFEDRRIEQLTAEELVKVEIRAEMGVKAIEAMRLGVSSDELRATIEEAIVAFESK